MKPDLLHWCPKSVEEWPYTACGLWIDEGQGLAWTRSPDLESYQHRPYETWPPPCPACKASISFPDGEQQG